MQPNYYALVYFTVTGEIVDEIPMTDVPSWLTQINNDGSWSINTLIGEGVEIDGLHSKERLRGITDSWRFSIAICWGTGTRTDYICQAGPIISDQLTSEEPPILQIGGAGLWALLRATLQLNSTWNGVSLATGQGSDTAYTSSMQGIAANILSNAVARNPMPLDVPSPIGGPVAWADFGYNLDSAGDKLQSFTQQDGGPDVLLKAYFADDNHIRHAGLIGTPSLAPPGLPLVFDYPGNVTSILPTRDGSKFSKAVYVKGDGSSDTTLWAKATNSNLGAQFPNCEYVDSDNANEDDQGALQRIANGDLAQFGGPVETWSVTVRMDDEDYPFGSYDVGPNGQYNVRGHRWLLDGLYNRRLIGMQNSSGDRLIQHILQGVS